MKRVHRQIGVFAMLIYVASAYAAGDPNEQSGRNNGGTEAGLSSSKNSSQTRMNSNTSGTYRDDQGKTRDYNTNRVVQPKEETGVK